MNKPKSKKSNSSQPSASSDHKSGIPLQQAAERETSPQHTTFKEYIGPRLGNENWEKVNLGVVDWSHVEMLGDEYEARQLKGSDGKEKDRVTQINEYQTALRANHQIAAMLQDQGSSEEAAHFAYRAKTNQRHILLLKLLQNIAGLPGLSILVKKPSWKLDAKIISLRVSLGFAIFCFVFFVLATIFKNNHLIIKGDIPLFNIAYIGLQGSIILGLFSVIVEVVIFYPLIRLMLLSLLLTAINIIVLFYISLFLFFILGNPSIPFFGFLAFTLVLSVMIMDEQKRENGKKLAHRVYSLPFIQIFIQIQAGYGRLIFSLFLDLLAGYGYKPGRTLFWYLVVIIGFTTAYHTIGNLPLLPNALVFSLTSFHGRGFFPGIADKTSLDNPLVVLAAIEAVVGLLIEASFIATFTQRFFGK